MFCHRPRRTSTPSPGNQPPHQHRVGEATENFTRRSSVHCRGSGSADPMRQASGVAWARRSFAGHLVQAVPRLGSCRQPVVRLWVCSVRLVGSRQSCRRVDNRTLRRWDKGLLCAFPAAVHVRRVEDIQAEMFQPLLRRRSAFVILVGGSSPCHNPTSHQPHQLARLVQDVTNLPEERDASTQVIGWLETASSAPDEVKRKYVELLGAQHFEIAASDFGWVNQNRTLWVSFSSGSLESGINRLVKLWPVFFLTVLAYGSQHRFQNSLHRPEANSCASPYRERFLARHEPTSGHGSASARPLPSPRSFSLDMDPRDVSLLRNARAFPAQAYEAKQSRVETVRSTPLEDVSRPSSARTSWRYVVFLSQL